MLTDVKIKNLKPLDKPKKYFDRDGLYLLVSPTGKKYWKIKYQHLGNYNTYSIGQYPHYSLSDARTKLFNTQKMLNEGKDPNADKVAQKLKAKQLLDNTFSLLAKEWYDSNKGKWTPKHQQKVWNRLERYALPVIGNKPVTEIIALNILNGIIRQLEKEKLFETAHKLLGNISAVFRLAVITNRLKYNPIEGLRCVLQPIPQKNRPSIHIDELPELIELLNASDAAYENKIAIKLLMLTFMRPVELRKSKWEYVDFDKMQWVIPAEIMKMRKEHIVPISIQQMRLLEQLHKLTGNSEYLFPTKHFMKEPHMNVNTMNDLLKKLGYKDKHCAHGFRSLASTTLNELKPEWADVIETQLAHIEQNKVRRAYNRAKYLPQRIELMQFWSDAIHSKIKGLI